MKNLRNVDDFVNNEQFVEWVLRPNEQSDQYWNNWMTMHPESEIEIKEAADLVRSFKVQEKNISYEEIMANYDQMAAELSESKANQTISTSRRQWLKYAASILLTGSIALAIFLSYKGEISSEFDQEAKLIEKEVPAGQKNTLKLADGSIIKLNAQSLLKFPERFEEDRRVVYLTGEAFFDIAEDKDRPFIIKTDKLETVVLGTSFNIKAYERDRSIQIAVISGTVKVQYQDAQPISTLTRKEMITYDTKTDDVAVSTFSDEINIIGWKDGILTFNRAGFDLVKEELSKWYGVEIIVRTDVNMGKGFTGKFENSSLETVLNGIAYVGNFKFKIDDKKNKVIIY